MAEATVTQRKLPEPFHSLWEALNSLPIAIVVMLLLAILSAIGTVIPQEHLARPEGGISMDQMYTERFGVATFNEIPLGKAVLKIPTSKHALIESLGLKHVYFTPYFFILLVWLSVSAVVCNITRFKRTVKQWKDPTVIRGKGFFGGDKRSIEVEGLTGGLPAVAKSFTNEGYRVFTREKDGEQFLYADKGFLKRWALVLMHFSILILIFGGCYGKIYGVESYIRLADNESTDLTLDLHKGKLEMVHPLIDQVAPLTFHLDQDHFRIDYDKKIKLPKIYEEMHAAGRLSDDDLEYERYFVKDFVSQLTMERNGRVKTQEVKVNHPIKLDKLVMYQSGYVQVGYLSFDDGSDGVREYSVVPDRWLALGPNGLVDATQLMGMNVDKSQYSTDAFILRPVKAGDLYVGGEKQEFLGPLSLVQTMNMQTGQGSGTMLITPDKGFQTSVGGTPVTVRMSTRVDNYSDFSYKRDPGIPILYFGWIAMIIGVALTMYIPFSQAWVRIKGSEAQLLLTGRGGVEDAKEIAGQWNDILSTP